MALAEIKALVQDDFNAVNQLIQDTIQSKIDLINHLAHHIVDSGGKRLRPLLVLLSAHACRYHGQTHIKLAAMVEFFHTATLLHDDVIDESTLRRGKKTANEIWGNKASILVGDYLYTQSVRLMIADTNWNILRLMADTQHQISSGEIEQLMNRHNPSISLETYLHVIQSKTSFLFAACAAIGAILGETDEVYEKAMYQYGLHLGNAFQLIDDVLDYSADVQTLGKNIGDDFSDGKATMPLIHAWTQSTPDEQALILDNLKSGDLTQLDAVMAIISRTNAIEYTREFAKQEVKKSIQALDIIPDSTYKNALIKLAWFSVNRQS